MRFTVPQFIEHKAKIVGPLTFRQFIIVGIAGAVCLVFYYTVSFSIFLISLVVIGGTSLAFAFLKIGGRSLGRILGNFLKFSTSPKMYIWKKKKAPIITSGKEQTTWKKAEDELPLKIAERSQLKRIKTQIETKTK